MTDICGIQLLLEIREHGTDKVLVEQTLTLKYIDGGKLFGGWIKITKNEYDHEHLQVRLKQSILHLLESKNIHDRQQIGHAIFFEIKHRNWYIDTCVLDTKQFKTIVSLEEWFKKNSISNFDQFLN